MTWETGASSPGSAELTDRPQASLRNECSSSIHGQTQLVFILPRAWSSECLGESLWLLLRMWGTLHCQHVGLAEAHRAWEENSGTKEVQVPNTPGQAVFQVLMGLHSTPAVLLGPQTAASTTPDQCPLALSWLARMIQPFSSETNRYGSLNDCAQLVPEHRLLFHGISSSLHCQAASVTNQPWKGMVLPRGRRSVVE